ncbi:MAG: ornithine carbamoyltransferase [Candidatus Omnitrophica bacterium]|nr:ornithine carbamoyltransferase [Candidatus Omnitrophota bacterium]
MNRRDMTKKDIITIRDLSTEEILELMRVARKLKKSPFARAKALRNKTLALLFQKPSNRTRVSFEVGMAHLGGYTLYLSPQEIDMGGRETVKDVACVISRYVDGIVVRVFAHQDAVIFARYSAVPVINGLSDFAHPCQALSDVFTIREKFGSLKKRRIAFIGDGNNVLNSLLMTCARTGVSLNIATPRGYEPEREVFEEAAGIAKKHRAVFNFFNDPHEAVKGCDAVYTDVWISMGQENVREQRLKDFEGFQVNETLMRATGKDALIMHCLPAHRGEEITDIIDGKNSIVYDQAENRMHVEKAVLLKTLRKRG